MLFLRNEVRTEDLRQELAGCVVELEGCVMRVIEPVFDALPPAGRDVVDVEPLRVERFGGELEVRDAGEDLIHVRMLGFVLCEHIEQVLKKSPFALLTHTGGKPIYSRSKRLAKGLGLSIYNNRLPLVRCM